MEIRLIKKSEWDILAAFNAVEYKPEHILTNRVYYNWQFNNYANPSKDSYTTVGMFYKGELIGTFGRFPLAYTFYGKQVEGNCMANLIIKKNLRSIGYGYFLLEQTSRLGDIAIDHTINETAWPMFIKAGWQGENLKRFIYIINPENELYRLPEMHQVSLSSNGLLFERIARFDSAISAFWKHAQHRYPVTIERTPEYLNWRYADNPFTSYHHCIVRGGNEIKALAILRIEEVRRDGKSIGVQAARLIDFISDEEAECFMLARIIKFCRERKIDFIDYFSSGSFHDKALASVGFVDGDTNSYSLLPILFNPVSTKRTHLNFAVKTKEPIKLEDWYTTKGGGDQDRPY